MSKQKTTGGRSRGGHNKGFWFRSGRGWYVTIGKASVPLLDGNGNHIKDPTDKEGAGQAYARHVLGQGGMPSIPLQGSEGQVSMMELCRVYLDHANKHDAPSTYTLRRKYLVDFSTGFSVKFENAKQPPKPSDRIHPGFGGKPASELIGLDVAQWLDAHKDWRGCRRSAVASVRRALCYGVEMGLLLKNPIRGFKMDRPGKRITYFSEEQEQQLLANSCPALAFAIRVCIATGARPLSEFAALESRHVIETPDGQVWRFGPKEHKTGSKTGKDRVVYIPDWVAEIVRELQKRYPHGKLFRNSHGTQWTPSAMREAFSRARRKLAKSGCPLDRQSCMYSCRHTFARRTLGKGASLEILAGLMGNSPKICWEVYAHWIDRYTSPLWAAIRS